LIELSESLFQILLLIAYLAIALISVVIATYAIAVSYLGRETSRAIWRMKKRRQELREKIKKLGEKAEIEEVKQEIKRYEKEESELKSRLFFLSRNGAVLFPCFCYFMGLIIVAYDIYRDPGEMLIFNVQSDLSQFLAWCAVILIVFGIFYFVRTLGAIESAALRIPLPKLEVSYISKLPREKYHSKEHKEIEIAISNNGEVPAENVQVFVFFPPEFTVGGGMPHYQVVKQGPTSSHPDYNAVVYTVEFLHIDVTLKLKPIRLDMPEKTGSYTIPVAIYERKIGVFGDQLALEIVS